VRRGQLSVRGARRRRWEREHSQWRHDGCVLSRMCASEVYSVPSCMRRRRLRMASIALLAGVYDDSISMHEASMYIVALVADTSSCAQVGRLCSPTEAVSVALVD
jgi:hypothetical protein